MRKSLLTSKNMMQFDLLSLLQHIDDMCYDKELMCEDNMSHDNNQ